MISDKELFEKMYAKLDAGLPEYLTYHNRQHTEYVVEMADYIAVKEDCDAHSRRLISIAALFHDSGFLIGPENQEENGCVIARDELSKEGLSDKEIDQICGMIMSTKIPQKPVSHEDKIVADADLYYLGTNRYDFLSQKLLEELQYFEPFSDERKWIKIQIDFLEAHHYHTDFARENLAPVKSLNLKRLHDMYKSL